MIKENNDMFIIIIFKAFLKVSLGWFGLMAIFQNVLNEELFSMLMNAMPSQVAMFFAFFYMMFIVFKKGSDAWYHHQTNKLNLKKEIERLEQEEIHTEKNRRELKND